MVVEEPQQPSLILCNFNTDGSSVVCTFYVSLAARRSFGLWESHRHAEDVSMYTVPLQKTDINWCNWCNACCTRLLSLWETMAFTTFRSEWSAKTAFTTLFTSWKLMASTEDVTIRISMYSTYSNNHYHTYTRCPTVFNWWHRSSYFLCTVHASTVIAKRIHCNCEHTRRRMATSGSFTLYSYSCWSRNNSTIHLQTECLTYWIENKLSSPNSSTWQLLTFMTTPLWQMKGSHKHTTPATSPLLSNLGTIAEAMCSKAGGICHLSKPYQKRTNLSQRSVSTHTQSLHRCNSKVTATMRPLPEKYKKVRCVQWCYSNLYVTSPVSRHPSP